MAASKFKSLQNSIDGLNKVVTDGFANIHTDIDNLGFEFKTEIEGIKSTIKDIERGLETTQEDVESVKEDVKKVSEDFLESTNTLSGKIVKLEPELSKSPEVTEALNAKIVKLKTQLKQQEQENIRLEQYTRRENLRYTYKTSGENGPTIEHFNCNVSMLCWCSSMCIFKSLFVSCELIPAFPSYLFPLRGCAICNGQYKLNYK